MALWTLQVKSIALLVVGIIIISSVFVVFNVEYPSQPATLLLNPPKTQHPPLQIFNPQGYNSPGLGQNTTSFAPTGNVTVTMQGYVYQQTPSGLVPIANKILDIAVLQAIAQVRTNSLGFYSLQVLMSGRGVFAFEIFQFNTLLKNVFIPTSGTYWVNLTMTPASTYQLSGQTVSLGKPVGNVLLHFSNFFGSYPMTSDSGGIFSGSMVNGTYQISAVKTGFSNVTVPLSVKISGSSVTGETITLHPITSQIFNITGLVLNDLGNPIPNASVYSVTLNILTHANANGYYKIGAVYGYNSVAFGAVPYVNTTESILALDNVTYNAVILSKDPFYGLPTVSQNLPSSQLAPSGLGNNSSSVNYTKSGSPYQRITGVMQSSQTGQKIAGQPFTAYTSVNGTYSFFQFSTDSGGNYVINFSYQGRYVLLIESSTFKSFNMSSGSSGSNNNFLNTSGSNVFNISGSVMNGSSGKGLPGVNVTISPSPGGPSLVNYSSNQTGNFSGKLLNGTYYVTYSKPGYQNVTKQITVTGNQTLPPVNLTPDQSVGQSLNQWTSSSSGVPGTNSSGVSSTLNSSQGSNPAPTTYSWAKSTYTLHLVNGSKGPALENVPVEIFVKTNGVTYRDITQTDATGNVTLGFNFTGTFEILPEMIQFKGEAKYVNTSYQTNGTYNMTPYTLYSLWLNVINPLNYPSDSVPVTNYLTVGNYSLSIYPSYPYGSNVSSANLTNATFRLPNGPYYISYVNPSYVPASKPVNLTSNSLVRMTVHPYVAEIFWNSTVKWSYNIVDSTGRSVSNTTLTAGQGLSSIVPLQFGSYEFTPYIDGQITGSGSAPFSLSYAQYVKHLQFAAATNNAAITTKNYHYSSSNNTNYLTVTVNLSIPTNALLYNVSTNFALPSSTDLFLNGANYTSDTNVIPSNISLVNYFMIASSGQTEIKLDIFNIGTSEMVTIVTNGVEIQAWYYTTNLKVS